MADKIHTEARDSKIEIQISGQITDETQFPTKLPPDSQELTIHFMDSCYINSSGIRTWMQWMMNLVGTHLSLKIKFLAFPPAFVRQVASIKGFIPESAEISSLRAPYYCDSCAESHDILLEWGTDLNPKDSDQALVEQLTSRPCERCGNSTEIDAVPEHFLLTRPKSL